MIYTAALIMIVVIIPLDSDKSLTVLLLEGVIVQVYFNTMACKKVSFLTTLKR